MNTFKVTFEITHQLLRHTSFSTEDLEKIKKSNISQLFVKEMIKRDLIKIELDKTLPATPEHSVDTYIAECYIQTTEEHNKMINEFRHLEATIMGLTSANTQETLLR